MLNDSNNYEEIKTGLESKSYEITKIFKQSFQQDVSDINTVLQTYNNLLMNDTNVLELYEIIAKENELLKKDISATSGVIITNNRKSIYENEMLDHLQYWYYWFNFFYILIIVGFVIGLFLLPWETPRRNYIILLILLCIYPFTISYLIGLEKKIFSWFHWSRENPSTIEYEKGH